MKAILWVVVVVVLALVGVGVYVVMFSGDLVKDAIETYGPRYLGADVHVDSVELALTEGTGELRDLEIGNPTGFDGGQAFSLGKIRLVLDPEQISQDLVVLKLVEIDGAQVSAIARGKNTNLQRLLDNVNAAVGSGAEDAAADESEVRLIIDRLDFTKATASVTSDVLGGAQLNLPDIHLTGVGRSSGGATVGQVLAQLLAPISRNVSRQLVEKGLNLDTKDIEGDVQDNLSRQLKGFTEKLGQ